MTMPAALATEIVAFVQAIVTAMGLSLQVIAEDTEEATQVNLEGEDGGVFTRRSGEGLQALQHLVAAAFRSQLGHEHRVIVDCMGFRKEKDRELREMARFTAEKAKLDGSPQEMGPLNPYERRIIHLTIAECPGVASESIGDAFLKTVIISAQS
jgi:spoIIIJ-associated protein